MLSTPVLLIAFNRPDKTLRVIDNLRQVKPARIYYAVDGARANKPNEAQLCEEVRKAIDTVDWPCEVHKLYRDKNLGCKTGVATAIDWFFENEEEGIILEDDILPDPSFYTFVKELLEKYRHDTRVMTISGYNPLPGTENVNSYFFSKLLKAWGWASWRRAWQVRNLDKAAFDQAAKEKFFDKVFEDSGMAKSFYTYNYRTHYEQEDTWDHQFAFNILSCQGLVIIPAVNLIDNIGFDSGTHFHGLSNEIAETYMPGVKSIEFPLKHPAYIYSDNTYDRDAFYKHNPFLVPKKYTMKERIKDSLKYRLGIK